MKFHTTLFVLLVLYVNVGAQPQPRLTLAEAQADYRKAKAKRDTLAMAGAAYLVGKRYYSAGNVAESRRWMLTALGLWESRGPSPELSKTYIQLAGASVKGYAYTEAYRYAHLALKNSRQTNDPHSLMSACSFLAVFHMQTWQAFGNRPTRPFNSSPDSAWYYINRAESIARTLNNPLELAYIWTSQGVMLQKENPRQAIALCRRALVVMENQKIYLNQARLHYQLANGYTNLNELGPSSSADGGAITAAASVNRACLAGR